MIWALSALATLRKFCWRNFGVDILTFCYFSVILRRVKKLPCDFTFIASAARNYFRAYPPRQSARSTTETLL
jgi:hypothetical protein